MHYAPLRPLAECTLPLCLLIAACTVQTGGEDDGTKNPTGGRSNAMGGNPSRGDDGGSGGVNERPNSESIEAFLRSLPEPTPPEPAAETTAQCGAREECSLEATPEWASGEFACGYELTTERQVLAENLVAAGTDPDLWPGNIVFETTAIAGGLDAIPIARAPLRLSTTLAPAPNGVSSVEMGNPSNSGYRDALATLLDGHSEPNGTAVSSFINVTTVLSREDLSTALELDVESPDLLPIAASFKLSSRQSTTSVHAKVAVSFVQSYFRVIVDPPSRPSALVSADVTAQELEDALAEELPVYVRSVTYGRRVLALFEDASHQTTDELAREIGASYRAVSGSVEATTTEALERRTSKFTAVVFGDDEVLQSIDELNAYLKQPPDLAIAWPIGYTLEYVADGSPFKVARTTELVERACETCGREDPTESDPKELDGKVVYCPSEQDPENCNDVLSDEDSADGNIWTVNDAVLLSSSDRDWFRFTGRDDLFGIVDPQATLSTESDADIRLCLFVTCPSGSPDIVCTLGEHATEGSLDGCCSFDGSVQLEGGTASIGLCEDGSDDAVVNVLVDGAELAATSCVAYDLSMHY